MRKFFLILCIAFAVVCFGYPCIILPLGEYSREDKVLGETVKTTYEFKFNGKVKIKIGDIETECYYKLKGDEVVISEDDKFDDKDGRITISSVYKVGDCKNELAKYASIVVGVVAVLLVISIPSKRNG